MATFRYDDPGTLTLMTGSELNSLGNGANALGSVVYDNRGASANGYFWGDFEFTVTFAGAPTSAALVELYLLPALDGTNYTDGSGSVLAQSALFVGGWEVRAVTTAQRLTLRGIVLPPARFKVLVRNNSGQAFPGSGAAVNMLPYSERSV